MKRLKGFMIDIEKVSFARLWLFFFIVSLLIILLVQLVLLPYFFSSWHAGHGLLEGGDWLVFHQEAVIMVESISNDGWSAWELRPKGWFPSGVAAVFYSLFTPQPWVLAPLNAAVHAFSALLVIKILAIFVKQKSISVVAALPFIFFPSSMLWYTQIHRDGYSILGMLLFLYGMLLIIPDSEKLFNWLPSELAALPFGFSGIILIWLSRPYQVVVFQYIAIMILFVSFIFLVIMALKNKNKLESVLIKALVIVVFLGMIAPFTNTSGSEKYQREPQMNNYDTRVLLASNREQVDIQAGVIDDRAIVIRTKEFVWERTPLLPLSIDNQLYSIAIHRSVWYPVIYGDTASGIDTDISFHSAIDFVYYLPRALQIAFLAPFPSNWFGEGTYESTTFFRRISALEMSFIYLMLAPMAYALWVWRKKFETYILFSFCTIMMMPIIYITPNLGTIYRYRYGFLMLTVSLSLAALLHFIAVKRKSAFR